MASPGLKGLDLLPACGHPLCAGFCVRPGKQEELAATEVRRTGGESGSVLVPNTLHLGERVMFPVAPEDKATPVGTLLLILQYWRPGLPAPSQSSHRAGAPRPATVRTAVSPELPTPAWSVSGLVCEVTQGGRLESQEDRLTFLSV